MFFATWVGEGSPKGFILDQPVRAEKNWDLRACSLLPESISGVILAVFCLWRCCKGSTVSHEERGASAAPLRGGGAVRILTGLVLFKTQAW